MGCCNNATNNGSGRAMETGLKLKNFKKIKVDKPVVDLDGDEMTRIIWQLIKDKVSGNSDVIFMDETYANYFLSLAYLSLPRYRHQVLRPRNGE